MNAQKLYVEIALLLHLVVGIYLQVESYQPSEYIFPHLLFAMKGKSSREKQKRLQVDTRNLKFVFEDAQLNTFST